MEINITVQLEHDITDDEELELLKRVKCVVTDYLHELKTGNKANVLN